MTEARCILDRSKECPGDCMHHNIALAQTRFLHDFLWPFLAKQRHCSIDEIEATEVALWKDKVAALATIAENAIAMQDSEMSPKRCNYVQTGEIKLPHQG